MSEAVAGMLGFAFSTHTLCRTQTDHIVLMVFSPFSLVQKGGMDVAAFC